VNEPIDIIFGNGICDSLCAFNMDIFKIEVPAEVSALVMACSSMEIQHFVV
jgi:hypothetical protein